METAQSLYIIDCLTDLTVSILMLVVYIMIYYGKGLLRDVPFRSFGVLEIAKNKNREFPVDCVGV